MEKFLHILILLPVSMVAACAPPPEQVTAAYISPDAYAGYSCAQMNQEAARISQALAVATGNQKKQADNDAAITAVGMILFWPALFALNGDRGSSAELARVKGEAEALQKAAVAKGCNG